MKALREGESGTKGARRIVRREAAKALEGLATRGPASDDAIHGARKRLKRARAALRLVRKSLGARRFQRENQAIRSAGGPLGSVRDAKALVETFDALAAHAARRERPVLRRVRRVLVARQLEVRRRVLGRKGALRPVVSALRSVRRRSATWPIGRHGWSVLGPGVRRVYRAGRKVWQAARRTPSVGSLHELRKQTKYLRHQLQILEPISPPMLRELADQAHQLSDYLGADHDLAVLQRTLSRRHGSLPATAIQTVSRMIDRRREELRAKALAVGARVYRETPGRFVKRLEARWRAWRSQAGPAAEKKPRPRARRPGVGLRGPRRRGIRPV